MIPLKILMPCRNRLCLECAHAGRFIGFVSRVSPVRGLIKLPDVSTVKGAPPPVETKAQVTPALKGRLGRDHVVFTDAAPAYCKPLAAVGAKHAAVNHGKRQFARFHKWPLAEMSSQLRALAAKRAAQQKDGEEEEARRQDNCHGSQKTLQRGEATLQADGEASEQHHAHGFQDALRSLAD